LVEAEEGAAYGAAVLAGVGARVWSTVDEACKAIVRVKSRIRPEKHSASILRQSYRTFRALYPAIRPVLEGPV